MFVFDNDDVKNVLSMDVCLDAIEETYRDYGSGNAVNIPRADMLVPRSRFQGQILKIRVWKITRERFASTSSQSNK